jgi:hypothetical protein
MREQFASAGGEGLRRETADVDAIPGLGLETQRGQPEAILGVVELAHLCVNETQGRRGAH